MKKEVSIIIPAYNEGSYIKKLAEELTKAKLVKEVILVDDKSEKQFSDIYNTIKGIKIIHKEKNGGKDKAIETGYKASTGSYILVLDADLQNLKASQVDKVIEKAQEQNLDIVPLIRGVDETIFRLVGTTYMTLGEHLLKKSVIEDNYFVLFEKTAWSFDNEINTIILNNPKYKVEYMEFKGVSHIIKTKKYQPIKGLLLDLKMVFQVMVKKYHLIGYVTTYMKLSKYINNREVIS